MTYKPIDRQILITTEAPSTNPPNGIVYQWVDNDGFLHQLDSNGNNQRYVNLEELNQKVATSDIVDNLTSTDTDKPLSANQGKLLQDNKEDADSTILKEGDVEDSLNSTSTTKPLSANQGKVLQDGKEDADSTILKESDVENTLTSTSTTKPLSANQGKTLEDNKADTSSLGTMASQNSDNVDITGGGAVLNNFESSIGNINGFSFYSDNARDSSGTSGNWTLQLNFSGALTNYSFFIDVHVLGRFNNNNMRGHIETRISHYASNVFNIHELFRDNEGSNFTDVEVVGAGFGSDNSIVEIEIYMPLPDNWFTISSLIATRGRNKFTNGQIIFA